MALRKAAGPIGKAQAPHIQRRGHGIELRSSLRLERICQFASTADFTHIERAQS
jgi:hypothetical protein